MDLGFDRRNKLSNRCARQTKAPSINCLILKKSNLYNYICITYLYFMVT